MREEEKKLDEVIEQSDEEDMRRKASSESDGFSNYGESKTNILIRSPIGHSDTLEETIKMQQTYKSGVATGNASVKSLSLLQLASITGINVRGDEIDS